MDDLDAFIQALPKAELHLHIEGTLEPELMLALSRRNGLPPRFPTVEAARAAYRFTDLQSFLDIYYEGAQALVREQDFYDLAWAYCERAAKANVKRAEVFFDPQTHTGRGVAFATVMAGLTRAFEDARAKLGLSSGLILCFLRHLSAEAAMETLEEALDHKKDLLAVGLDSAEKGNPPGKFAQVFARARKAGLRAVAHAGEEGPPSYVTEALDALGVERVDHGVRCLEDPELVERLVRERVPLTVCPLSNVRLRVIERLEDHPLKRLLDAGVVATVNSDDPAYFGGYVDENFRRAARALGLSRDEVAALARNSFQASFAGADEKRRFLAEIEAAA